MAKAEKVATRIKHGMIYLHFRVRGDGPPIDPNHADPKMRTERVDVEYVCSTPLLDEGGHPKSQQQLDKDLEIAALVERAFWVHPLLKQASGTFQV